MISIIEIKPIGDGKGPTADAEVTRAVRSHAMRHYRQQQRNARRKESNKPCRPLQPAVRTKRPAEQDRNPSEDEEPSAVQSTPQTAGPPSEISRASPSLVYPGGAGIPRLSNGATFYRYLLGEQFGASLIGDSALRPHCAGIRRYRGYVATTKSDLVRAVDDTLCLALPGCSLEDHRILLEARKRHLTGVQCLQRAIEYRKTGTLQAGDVVKHISAATELCFIEMFRPFSLGTHCLYDGLVSLVKAHWVVLTSVPGPMPVLRFLLAQLQQTMLMVSLDRRCETPIDVEAWRSLPHAAGLLSPISESLMMLAIEVPGLLAKTDVLLESDVQNRSGLVEQLAVLLSLDTKLVQWQREWCAGVLAVDPMSGAKSASLNRTRPVSETTITCGSSLVRKQCCALSLICHLLLQESAASISRSLCQNTSAVVHREHAKWTAEQLYDMAENFLEEEEGLLSKAFSVCAPLHFARRWFEADGDGGSITAARALETRAQAEVPFLVWDSLLPLSFIALYMLG